MFEYSHFFQSEYKSLVKEYLDNNAVVIDVRTAEEFQEEHAPDSILIAMNEIPTKVDFIKKLEKPIIIVCHLGQRAEVVKNYLLKFDIDVINGGPWQNVLKEENLDFE